MQTDFASQFESENADQFNNMTIKMPRRETEITNNSQDSIVFNNNGNVSNLIQYANGPPQYQDNYQIIKIKAADLYPGQFKEGHTNFNSFNTIEPKEPRSRGNSTRKQRDRDSSRLSLEKSSSMNNLGGYNQLNKSYLN